MLEESQNGQSTRNMIILFTRRIVLENFFQNFNMEMPVQPLIYSVGKLELLSKRVYVTIGYLFMRATYKLAIFYQATN